MDANRGLRNQPRDVGEPAQAPQTAGVLTDADIAQRNLDQATQMEAEANALLAEAKRLRGEADSFKPKTAKAKNVTKPKRTAKKTTA
jgi:hypothetical protein